MLRCGEESLAKAPGGRCALRVCFDSNPLRLCERPFFQSTGRSGDETLGGAEVWG